MKRLVMYHLFPDNNNLCEFTLIDYLKRFRNYSRLILNVKAFLKVSRSRL